MEPFFLCISLCSFYHFSPDCIWSVFINTVIYRHRNSSSVSKFLHTSHKNNCFKNQMNFIWKGKWISFLKSNLVTKVIWYARYYQNKCSFKLLNWFRTSSFRLICYRDMLPKILLERNPSKNFKFSIIFAW